MNEQVREEKKSGDRAKNERAAIFVSIKWHQMFAVPTTWENFRTIYMNKNKKKA